MDKSTYLSIGERQKVYRLLIVLFIILAINAPLRAAQSTTEINTDSVAVVHPKRNALLQALGIDLGIWAFNSYVAQKGWAKITMKSFRSNIESGWVLDDNSFHVNQFGHPFQGALVYTAARAQGLTFWQSIYYPVFSSFIWEMGMETEKPAINDMITTPLSGITYGEVLHRMSLIALGDHPGLKEEILAFIINPSLGVNRLFRKKSDRLFRAEKKKNFSAGFSAGGGGYFLKNQDELLPNQFIRFHLFYGEPFNKKKLKRPFDYFSFIAIVNTDRSEYVGELFSSGILKPLLIKKGVSHSYLVGIFKDYDYMNHDEFKVSSSSIGTGIIQNLRLSSAFRLYNEVFVNGILFGSAGGDSIDVHERNYQYGPGVSGKVIFILKYRNSWKLYTRLKRYLIFNVEEMRISRYENINLLKAGIQVHVWNRLSVGGEYTLVSRKPVGSILPEVLQKRDIFRFYVVYHIGNNNL